MVFHVQGRFTIFLKMIDKMITIFYVFEVKNKVPDKLIKSSITYIYIILDYHSGDKFCIVIRPFSGEYAAW